MQPVDTDTSSSGERDTLTLVLVANNKDEEDHYVVIPFPTTYDEVTAAAIKHLSCYMINPTSAIILRCSTKNRRGEWIWADFPSENWRTILDRNPAEVGVFEQPKPVALDPETFLRGPVRFTYWCANDNEDTVWSILSSDKHENSIWNQRMDRPESYAVAIERAKKKCRGIGNRNVFKFYTFPNDDLSSWVPFPPEAYMDESVWRAIVPLPGHILGVIVSRPPPERELKQDTLTLVPDANNAEKITRL